jgi:hypothetical protein
MFLPFQGGGQEGDGVSVGVTLICFLYYGLISNNVSLAS